VGARYVISLTVAGRAASRRELVRYDFAAHCSGRRRAGEATT
jgi:hypothetical protein